MDNSAADYAQLPDELLEDILGTVGETVALVKSYTNINVQLVDEARSKLEANNMLHKLGDGSATSSISAVDGSYAIERLTELDVALVQAAGVEGLSDQESVDWGEDRHQYMSWQAALPHSANNETIVRGIMAIMEILSLANSDHDIRIIDGSHFSFLIALSKLFSVVDIDLGRSVAKTIDDMLRQNGTSLAKLPEAISKVMHDDRVIASTKYSSSRGLVDSVLGDLDIKVDDRSLLTKILREDEYTTPVQIVGDDKGSVVWRDIHIKYAIDPLEFDVSEFDWLINEAIGGIKTVDMHGNPKSSDIAYMYYRPIDHGPVYRLEVKQSLAADHSRLCSVLRSLKNQTMYPDIIEPYPQYLADRIAKSVSKGLQAVKDAVVLSEDVVDSENNISMLRGYRT